MRIVSHSFWPVLVYLSWATVAVGAYPERLDNAARTMVEAEKNFYQAGQERGTRAAFLAFLADDGVVFRPGPVNGKKVWTERPETGLDLIWEPTFASMARSADFGFTSGPAQWKAKKEDEKPLGYGQFVSVWKKQKDGWWKVALDVGTENPRPRGPSERLHVIVPDVALNVDPAEARKALQQAQQKFAAAAKRDLAAALVSVASDNIRVYRDGIFPSIGKDAIASILDGPGKIWLEQIGGDMSSSRDIAYSYGKYSIARMQGGAQGFYVQIWQTDAKGAWNIIIDLQKDLPPPENKPAS